MSIKQRLVDVGGGLMLSASARLGTFELLRPRDQASASALLFHRFFDPGEPRARGVERLRRQLEWLRANYTPIALPAFLAGLASGALPDRAVLVTADDALLDLLGVIDEFKAFEVPLSVFVCAGWTASASKGVGEDVVARAAAAIQWHEGADMEVRCGERSFWLSPETKARNIDLLVSERDVLMPHLAQLCDRIEGVVNAPRQCCNWTELQALARDGVSFGAHSVTHVWMSTTSEVRRRFEVAESKRLCEANLGPCQAFAYPFGMAETQSEATRNELQRAGYTAAFLTHSEYITEKSDAFTLPRISMPDESMPLHEFQARASGVGIAVRRLKALVRGGDGL